MKRFSLTSLFVVFVFASSCAAQFSGDGSSASSENGVVTGQMEVRCKTFFVVPNFPHKLRLNSWGEIVQNNRKPPTIEITLEPLDAEFLQKEVAPPDFNARYGTGPWWQFKNYKALSYTEDERAQIFAGKRSITPMPIPLNQTAYFRSDGHYLAIKPVAVNGRHVTTARKEGQKVRNALYWDYVTLEWGYLSPSAVEKWRQRNGSSPTTAVNTAKGADISEAPSLARSAKTARTNVARK